MPAIAPLLVPTLWTWPPCSLGCVWWHYNGSDRWLKQNGNAAQGDSSGDRDWVATVQDFSYYAADEIACTREILNSFNPGSLLSDWFAESWTAQHTCNDVTMFIEFVPDCAMISLVMVHMLLLIVKAMLCWPLHGATWNCLMFCRLL